MHGGVVRGAATAPQVAMSSGGGLSKAFRTEACTEIWSFTS
jgi:hypothetical protein